MRAASAKECGVEIVSIDSDSDCCPTADAAHQFKVLEKHECGKNIFAALRQQKQHLQVTHDAVGKAAAGQGLDVATLNPDLA